MATIAFLFVLLALMILSVPTALPPQSRWVAFALALAAFVLWLVSVAGVRWA